MVTRTSLLARIVLAAVLYWPAAIASGSVLNGPVADAPAAVISRKTGLNLPRLDAIDAGTAALLADADDGRLDHFTLLHAALVAGGVREDDQLAACQQRFDGWCCQLDASRPESGSPQVRAAAVLQFLHGDLLVGGYRKDATSPEMAVRRGIFNCVSSVVLFKCLAEHCDLKVQTVALPSHVYCRIQTADKTFDVETTCADWFDGETNLDVVDVIAQQAPHAANGMRRNRRPISDVQLLALIYYNRGVQYFGRHDFARAVSASVAAHRLDPASKTIRDNLLAGLNNWALALADGGDFASAAAVLSQGISIAPDYSHFHQNEIYVHQQWVARLSHDNCFAEAVDIYAHDCWLAHLARTAQREKAADMLQEAHRAVSTDLPGNPGSGFWRVD